MKLINHYSKCLLVGASLIALGAPAIAHAQAAPNAVSEVIVTAQRRNERLQDVPISVTAVSAATLAKAGITNVTDLGRVVPGLSMPMYGAFLQPSIRGISSNVAGIGDSANTAIYLDGVYQAIEFALNFDLPDTQSVQVLKGPQGTLYGQNAAAGAIIIDTVTPSQTLKGKASISYGNFNDVAAKGYVTGPITDTLAYAISGAYEQHEGYNRNLLTGGHDKGLVSDVFRAKLLWRPSNAVSITLSGFYSNRFDSNPYSGPALDGDSIAATVQRKLFPNLPLATTGHTYATNTDGYTRVATYGMSLVGKFQVGSLGTLNTVSAYENVNFKYAFDIDRSPVNYLNYRAVFPDSYFLQEANFISNKFLDRFQVTGGVFFMDRVAKYAPNDAYLFNFQSPFAAVPVGWTAYPTNQSPLITAGGTSTRTQRYSYAAYLEGNIDITDKLVLTLAGRYAYETMRDWNTPLSPAFRYGAPMPSPLPDPRGSFHFEKFIPKGVLRYKFDQNNDVYFSASQGFKSGFVNSSNINLCKDKPGTKAGSCIDPPVQPEVVTAYEVGYKGKLNSQLSVTAAAFHYDYAQIQLFVYDPILGSYYQNAASGTVNGGEIGLIWVPTPALTVNLGGAYTDAKYSKFPNANVYKAIPGGGNVAAVINATGKPMIRAPLVTVNGSFNYTHSFAALGRAAAYLGISYNDSSSFDPAGRVTQPAYTLVDSELSFIPASMPNLRLVLWGKNLTDALYFSAVLEGSGSDNVAYAAPRTFGVRAEYSF